MCGGFLGALERDVCVCVREREIVSDIEWIQLKRPQIKLSRSNVGFY